MKQQIADIIKNGVCSGDSSWDEITIEILNFMREPTEKMLIVAGHQQHIVDYYQAMIDAVISDD